MATVIPSGETLGATVEGLDLAQPLAGAAFDLVVDALGELWRRALPAPATDRAAARATSARASASSRSTSPNAYQEPGIPEVMILSNIVENGKPIGLADAGQDWHTDMSYSTHDRVRERALRHRDPAARRQAARARPSSATCTPPTTGCPADLKRRLDGMTVLHDFNKFWEMMRREKGSKRPPLTEAQRKAKPPVSHPIFLTHPITGRKVLYANPGYSMRINELPEKESDEMLEFLFAHQMKPEYRYTFRWQEGDVLMWEDIGTIHNAVADYGPDEHRLIKRCQVMATRFVRGMA